MRLIKNTVMKKHLLLTKLLGAAAVLCMSLLFVNCSEIPIEEPAGEAGTRAERPYLQVTSSATEFYVGIGYKFGLEMVHPEGFTTSFDNPSIVITGGSYTVMKSIQGGVSYMFNEGAIYTVTAMKMVGDILFLAELEVNTIVFMRVEYTWNLHIVPQEPMDGELIEDLRPGRIDRPVIFTNKLVFYADSAFTRRVNVTKPVIAGCCHYKPSQPGGPIYHPYWYTVYLNYPDSTDFIINGEYETMNTYGWLNAQGDLVHNSYISATIDFQ